MLDRMVRRSGAILRTVSIIVIIALAGCDGVDSGRPPAARHGPTLPSSDVSDPAKTGSATPTGAPTVKVTTSATEPTGPMSRPSAGHSTTAQSPVTTGAGPVRATRADEPSSRDPEPPAASRTPIEQSSASSARTCRPSRVGAVRCPDHSPANGPKACPRVGCLGQYNEVDPAPLDGNKGSSQPSDSSGLSPAERSASTDETAPTEHPSGGTQ